MRTYLVRIPHRKGHSIQSDVLLASAIVGPSRRIHGPPRVGPNGRDLELPSGNSDRTTGPKFGSSALLSGWSISTTPSGRLPYLRPGRRIGQRWEPTRAPSQGPTPNGAARCRPIRVWHPGAKSSGLGSTSATRCLAYPLIHRVVAAFLSFVPLRVLGTPHSSSVCSACARWLWPACASRRRRRCSPPGGV